NQAGGLISNQAGGLISNQAGGLISNQAGGLISNQAGGLISNQAGGLISNQAGGLISNVPGGANLSDGALRAFRLVAEKDGQALVTVVDGLGQGLSEGGAAGYRLQQAGGTILVELSPATTAVAKAFEGALKLQFELAEPGARAAGLSEVFVQARQATRAVRAQLRKDPDLARRIAAAVDARGALRDVQAFQRSAAEGQLDRELAPRVVEVLNAFVARKGSQGGAGEARGGGPRLDGRDFPLGDVTVERGGVVVVKAKNGDTVRIDRPVPGREAGAAKPSDKAPVARNARPAAGTGGNNGNGNAGGGADNGNGNAGGNNGNGNAGGNNGNGNAGGNTGNAGGGTDNGNAGGNIGNGNAGGGADNGNAGGSNGNGNAGGGTGNGNGSGGNGGGNGNGNG
ncbi:MAG: hypothetical protein VKS61_18205, partial [Candidatus Sericytochromatia bacterium]|nr:hypothetical protein [Candidatus Sericytochromatia bacterium]